MLLESGGTMKSLRLPGSTHLLQFGLIVTSLGYITTNTTPAIPTMHHNHHLTTEHSGYLPKDSNLYTRVSVLKVALIGRQHTGGHGYLLSPS
jgi:hypothetical protein